MEGIRIITPANIGGVKNFFTTMHRIPISVFLILILASCSNQDSNEFEIFENTLGKKYANILTDGLERFEEELVRLYPSSDINESYRELAYDIATWNDDNYKPFGRFDTTFVRQLIEYFQTYNLEKEIFLNPSFVGIKNGQLTIIYDYINDQSDTIRVSEGGLISPNLKTMNLDSFIQEEYSVIEYNKYGLYHQAICNIESQDSLIIKYIESKNTGYPVRVLNF